MQVTEKKILTKETNPTHTMATIPGNVSVHDDPPPRPQDMRWSIKPRSDPSESYHWYRVDQSVPAAPGCQNCVTRQFENVPGFGVTVNSENLPKQLTLHNCQGDYWRNGVDHFQCDNGYVSYVDNHLSQGPLMHMCVTGTDHKVGPDVEHTCVRVFGLVDGAVAFV